MQPDGNNILCKQIGPKALILQITIFTFDLDIGKGSTVLFAAVDEMGWDFFSYTQFNET